MLLEPITGKHYGLFKVETLLYFGKLGVAS